VTSISEAAAAGETKPRSALLASSNVALRWLVACGFVALALSGAISTDGRALLASCLLIGLYLCALTLHSLLMRPFAWLRGATLYFDAMAVTSVIVATGDIQSPAWGFYLIALVAAARFATSRATAINVAWCCLNYAFAAFAVQATGHDAAWGYAAAVLAAIALTGLYASSAMGAEERPHDVGASAATTDALTGLPNRHSFHATYVASMEEAIGRRMPMALMLIDVDNFKQLNERYGHPAGDAKLLDIAHLLESSLRRGDLVARYGGDEFVVIAVHHPGRRDDAGRAAARRRRAHRRHPEHRRRALPGRRRARRRAARRRRRRAEPRKAGRTELRAHRTGRVGGSDTPLQRPRNASAIRALLPARKMSAVSRPPQSPHG